MRCDECKRQIGTSDLRGFEETSSEPEIQAHLESCPECREWAASTRLISDTMRASAPLSASDGFTARVMDATQEPQHSYIAGLLSRWFGALRPVGPVIPRRAMAASLVVIIAAAVFAATVYAPGLAPGSDAVAARNAPAPVATISIAAENRSFDDLIQCHHEYQMSQPLGPDAGILAALDFQE